MSLSRVAFCSPYCNPAVVTKGSSDKLSRWVGGFSRRTHREVRTRQSGWEGEPGEDAAQDLAVTPRVTFPPSAFTSSSPLLPPCGKRASGGQNVFALGTPSFRKSVKGRDSLATPCYQQSCPSVLGPSMWGRTVHPSPRSTVLPTPSHASGLLENLVFPSDKKEEGSFMVEMLREERGAPGNAGLPPLGALAAVWH